MRKVLSICICLAACLSLFSTCQNKKSKHYEVSFYFWKQRLQLSDLEEARLQELNVKKLYVKFFDVRYDAIKGTAVPVADVNIVQKPSQEIIPCVFIANDVWSPQAYSNPDTLAIRIWKRIQALTSISKIKIREIHLDCDWTASTKNQFFNLIKALQHISNIHITSTLRLYQLKYPSKMGIPPVSSASLMCYNMKPAQDPTAGNSIYESQELKKYTHNLQAYPLKLSIALPLYSWVCVFRKKIFQGFINGVSLADINSCGVFKKEADGVYKCQKSINFKGRLVSKGDVLRLETSDAADLQEGLEYMSAKLDSDTISLIFYHLDQSVLQQHEKSILPILRTQ